MADIHWLKAVSGDFETGSEWSGGVVPGSSDDAFLDASGTSPYTITLTNSGIQFVNTLQTASTATLDIVDGDLSALHGAINAGTIVSGESSVFFQGNGSLINSGSIYAEDGGEIYVNGTTTNSGEIMVNGNNSSMDVGFTTLTGDGVVSLFHGTVFGGLDHGIEFLTNVDNTIEGSGKFVEYLNFTNAVAGIVDATRGHLIFNVHNVKITNAGLIEATDGGNCIIKSPVKNTGTLLANGGTLTLDAAVTGSGDVDLAAGMIVIENAGASETIAFTGKSGVLELTQSQTFAGRLSGFSRKGKTTLDLRDIGFVSPTEATFSGTSTSGVLTVTDGTHTAQIALKGNYLSTTFVASSDGEGGVDIVGTGTPLQSVRHFAVAMARMLTHGEAAAGAVPVGPVWDVHQTMLAAPRVAIF